MPPKLAALSFPLKKPELLQFNGYFQGGIISGLADHAAGGAVTTSLPPGRIAVTIDLHVNFLARADGEALLANARTVQASNLIAFAHMDVYAIRAGTERHCAIATATMRAVELPSLAEARSAWTEG